MQYAYQSLHDMAVYLSNATDLFQKYGYNYNT